MTDLANFGSSRELKAALEGKSKSDILRDAKAAGVDNVLMRVFFGMIAAFDKARAHDTSAVIQYEIEGPDQVHRYQVNVKNGECGVVMGAPEKPRVTLALSLPNFLKLVTGSLNPLVAIPLRQLKIKGDLKLAGKLQGWFSRPT